nr:Ig-like domain-containing protein [Limosilactobacillus mucosae]
MTSTTPTVATVDQSGNIKAIAPGTTTIKATIGTKTSNVVKITVYEALVNVSNLTSSNVTTNSVGLSWT